MIEEEVKEFPLHSLQVFDLKRQGTVAVGDHMAP